MMGAAGDRYACVLCLRAQEPSTCVVQRVLSSFKLVKSGGAAAGLTLRCVNSYSCSFTLGPCSPACLSNTWGLNPGGASTR